MTVIDLLKKIQKTLTEEQNSIAQNMLLGQMSSFEAYKKSVGVAEGLERASGIISEMMKKLDDEEDV